MSGFITNRLYRLSNTLGTKNTKLGLKSSILHFEMDKTIKFERIQYEQANLTQSEKYDFTKKSTIFYSITMILSLNNLPMCRFFSQVSLSLSKNYGFFSKSIFLGLCQIRLLILYFLNLICFS